LTATTASSRASARFRDQPRAVWAVAFACVVAFMGIGLVDPILPVIARDLKASPSQVSLLFTTYFAMTGISMLVTGYAASRIGPKRTLLTGLALVVIFAALAGAAGSIFQIAAFRLGWGLGNALFIATALSVIVGSAAGGVTSAIIMYEAALGVGIASGPLLGGLLGDVSWRLPFFGTAVLMAIGFVLIFTLLGNVAKPRQRVSIADPLRALRHGGLRSMAIVALFYNFGFFTILAYTPLLLGLSAHQLGLIYFGWGLLVAVTSVFGAQRLERRFGLVPVLGFALAGVAVDLAAGGLFHTSTTGLIVVVVVSGALLGIVNTVLTEGVMVAAVVERPVASAAYSFVRFTGGAIAPYIAGKLGENVSAASPMYLGSGMVVLSVVALVLSRGHLRHKAAARETRTPVVVPRDVVLVALDSSPAARPLVETAERVARSRGTGVHVVHVRETRVIADDTADLEDRSGAEAVVAVALARLRRAGIEPVTGEVLHVTGHHGDAATAVLEAAERIQPRAIVLGGPGAHGGELGAPSLATLVVERAPCDVLVVATGEPASAPVAA
jgi:MFS transporter, ACDE family, multidrug resistance protein